MATIQDRNFSRTYGGLKNQFAVAGVLAAICLAGYELMRRRRRGGGGGLYQRGLASVETWEFGYLYQGRSWAIKPAPALPKFPLQWITQAITYSESSLPDLIGVDASLYVRFLRGCRIFVFVHLFTTFPIIFTIHIVFSPNEIPLNTMDKASISSLVPSEQRLLFVHVILAYWIATTWVTNLLWIARDTFRFRAQTIQSLSQRYPSSDDAVLSSVDDLKDRGLRLRTVMITNIPVPLRTEKDLKEYFEYYMSRPMAEPPIAFGFFTRLATLLYHRILSSLTVKRFKAIPDDAMTQHYPEGDNISLPAIQRVVIARKMTELASLLERHNTALGDLEYAHICLAKNVLQAIRDRMDMDQVGQELTEEEKEVWLALSPFVKRFHVPQSQTGSTIIKRVKDLVLKKSDKATDDSGTDKLPDQTVWEVLHSLPRSYLDRYQPLTSLRRLFRGKSVPAIDYYTARLTYLTALIHDDKSRPIEDYSPTSTAFVTFSNIDDARRAVKYLQTHPLNPLACLVVPAPDTRDLDWLRIMKSSFTGEFIKDWVIELGVWVFTLSWIIPISLLIGLVNIQNLSLVFPGLQSYFNKHPHDKEAITSLLPTIIFSLLTILIPVILLLIGIKGHKIITFSKLHDTIMIRYWKFLVCNLLIFFCVGVAALESFLQFFKHAVDFIPVIASSFPVAGPFYVGWCKFYVFASRLMYLWAIVILQTAIHGFLELGLFGLPLIVYPSTKLAKTPRRRAEGIRPRTFNFYYWLPNHLLVVTIVLLFSLLNPLVIPFAFVYFCVESVVVKHQLLHVYARTYENNGKIILIRIVRFSLDGLILAHVVFLAFLVVLKETAEAALIGVLLVLTVFTKLSLTRICRMKFAKGDEAEEAVFDRLRGREESPLSEPELHPDAGQLEKLVDDIPAQSRAKTFAHSPTTGTSEMSHLQRWKEFPNGAHFDYASYPPRRQFDLHRPANPFFQVKEDLPRSPEGGEVLTKQVMTEEPEQLNGLASSSNYRQPSQIVASHPPFPNWDDSPDLDRPYENPFYRASVENVLWLPRNPFGILDLDDTVDLHVALTSEGQSESLDRWLNEEEDNIPLTQSPRRSLASSSLSAPPPVRADSGLSRRSHFRPERQYTGMEDISMSSVLAARVNALENENRRNLVVRGNNNRRFSAASSQLHQTISMEANVPRRPRLHSRTYADPVHNPDLQAESHLLKDPIQLISSPSEEGARTPIPLNEAVLSEVVAEEQHHAFQRVQREAMEKQKQTRERYRPAWWRWFFWYSDDNHTRTETV